MTEPGNLTTGMSWPHGVEPSVPPLRPSEEPDLACAHKYAALQNIRVESIAGRRGTEFHRFMEDYVSHLRENNLSCDQPWWRASLDIATVGRDTRDLLDGYLPGFRIDPEKILHIEERLYMSSKFEPIEEIEPGKFACRHGNQLFDRTPAYSSKPDLIELTGPDSVRIPDWKSQFRIVDAAQSYQGKQYALTVFKFLPFVNSVEFEPRFIRWGNASRSITYTREKHLVHLERSAHKTRQRQIEVHEQAQSGNLEPAVSGPQCLGCPLRLKGCEIAEVNPYAQQSPEDLVRFIVWAEGATKAAREIVKDLFLHDKPPVISDGNGRTYEPGYLYRQKRKVPLAALETVKQWEAEGNEKRTSLLESLRIGGLTTKLKAKFRQPLLEKLVAEGHIETTDYTVFGIKISGIDQSEDSEEE